MSTTLTDEAKAHKVSSVSLAKLVFSGGDEVTLSPTDKIMLVGANNSGKSRTIREIERKCGEGDGYADLMVLKSISLDKVGSQKDLESYVQLRGKRVDTSYSVGDWNLSMYALPQWSQDYLVSGLAAGFIKNLNAASRLGICDLQTNIAPNEPASRPQHLLYRDDALMNQASNLFKRAFGVELMIDFLGGSRIPIHIGITPRGAGFEDRASSKYSQAVNAQPALHDQGDGMKSYAGIIFEAIASKRDILCIDEPEAFLHPPQARKLGEALSTNVSGQLIVATHSSDILRGFLEGHKGKVRILRILREGNVNNIYEANSTSIEELWKTPALRFSNALDAIFHDQAILCEDDSDCRLVSSMADHMQTGSDDSWPDTAYVPMGGKSNIPKAAAILRAVGVPVKAIFDFDFISDSNFVKAAVEAFGGSWAKISVHWGRVAAAIADGKPPSEKFIKADIQSILDNAGTDKLPKKREIDDAFKRRSQWAKVKEFGLNGVPKGDAYRECEVLIELLEQIGIYLVPSGEMESFCRSIGGHGPSFVTNVLTNVDLSDIKLQDLRNFTAKVHGGKAAPMETIGTVRQQLERAKAKAGQAQAKSEADADVGADMDGVFD